MAHNINTNPIVIDPAVLGTVVDYHVDIAGIVVVPEIEIGGTQCILKDANGGNVIFRYAPYRPVEGDPQAERTFSIRFVKKIPVSGIYLDSQSAVTQILVYL